MPIATLALFRSVLICCFKPSSVARFEALLHERDDNGGFLTREHVAPGRRQLSVYRENREITLSTSQRELGQYPESTVGPSQTAGSFQCSPSSVEPQNKTSAPTTRSNTWSRTPLVVMPMYDFYPRCDNATQGRHESAAIEFCFSESQGDARRADSVRR